MPSIQPCIHRITDSCQSIGQPRAPSTSTSASAFTGIARTHPHVQNSTQQRAPSGATRAPWLPSQPASHPSIWPPVSHATRWPKVCHPRLYQPTNRRSACVGTQASHPRHQSHRPPPPKQPLRSADRMHAYICKRTQLHIYRLRAERAGGTHKHAHDERGKSEEGGEGRGDRVVFTGAVVAEQSLRKCKPVQLLVGRHPNDFIRDIRRIEVFASFLGFDHVCWIG
ncbi:hypothetical protein K505DRAFT_62049 [Melanomma pulvis-pyrius CBS 109.77]|uniref:Uncharacterized protein n=1 Tax=Melanomma pulvis-pyrius CBS 109.77 TaxID=1314802 RepID=A0A6A6X6F7_9PLEO|nr:hypothetical protein K505DRAFT_62049 [Melanomma pulvis-pyrius CBS 109.77]